MELGDYDFVFTVVNNVDLIDFDPMKTIVEWCKMPYPRHPKGCKNISKPCRFFRPGLKEEIVKWVEHPDADVYVAWVEWDIDDWERRMMDVHPDWSRARLRNLLYWQPRLRKALWIECEKTFGWCRVIFGAEGCGVNFYSMMLKDHFGGIELDRPDNLHIVRVIAITFAFDNPTIQCGFPTGFRKKDENPFPVDESQEDRLLAEDL